MTMAEASLRACLKPEEVERNPRSRSAKLRVAVKNEELGMRN